MYDWIPNLDIIYDSVLVLYNLDFLVGILFIKLKFISDDGLKPNSL